MVIVGIALVGAGQYWSTISKREKEAELLFRGDQIARAIEAYYKSSTGAQSVSYPRSLEDLLKDTRFPGVRRYLRKVYSNPMSEDGSWKFIYGPGQGVKGVFADSEKKPLKTGNFPENYKDFEKAKTYADWKFVYVAGQPQKPNVEPPPAQPQQQQNGLFPDSGLGSPFPGSRRQVGPQSPGQGNQSGSPFPENNQSGFGSGGQQDPFGSSPGQTEPQEDLGSPAPDDNSDQAPAEPDTQPQEGPGIGDQTGDQPGWPSPLPGMQNGDQPQSPSGPSPLAPQNPGSAPFPDSERTGGPSTLNPENQTGPAPLFPDQQTLPSSSAFGSPSQPIPGSSPEPAPAERPQSHPADAGGM